MRCAREGPDSAGSFWLGKFDLDFRRLFINIVRMVSDSHQSVGKITNCLYLLVLEESFLR